jgi:hypothetical protein
MRRQSILILAAAAVWLLSSPVRAQGADVDIPCGAACILVMSGVFIVPPLVFATAQITYAYAAQSHWFPLGWAIPELIYGGLMTSLTFAVLTEDANGGTVVAPFAMANAWLTVHALLSIALNDYGAPASASTKPSRIPGIVAAPVPGGATLSVSGVW